MTVLTMVLKDGKIETHELGSIDQAQRLIDAKKPSGFRCFVKTGRKKARRTEKENWRD